MGPNPKGTVPQQTEELKVIENIVINISSYNLSPTELTLLNHGLGYIPTYQLEFCE